MTDFIKKEEKIEVVKRPQQFNLFTRWLYKIGGIIAEGMCMIVESYIEIRKGGKSK